MYCTAVTKVTGVQLMKGMVNENNTDIVIFNTIIINWKIGKSKICWYLQIWFKFNRMALNVKVEKMDPNLISNYTFPPHIIKFLLFEFWSQSLSLMRILIIFSFTYLKYIWLLWKYLKFLRIYKYLNILIFGHILFERRMV